MPILTVDELFEASGAPSESPTSTTYTTRAMLQEIIDRFLNEWKETVEEMVLSAPDKSLFARYAEPIEIVLTPGESYSTGTVPDTHIPYAFSARDELGNDLTVTDNLAAYTGLSVIPFFRYRLLGRKVEVLPKTATKVTMDLINLASVQAEMQPVETLNEKIVKEARALVNMRTAVAEKIKSAS